MIPITFLCAWASLFEPFGDSLVIECYVELSPIRGFPLTGNRLEDFNAMALTGFSRTL